MSNFITNSPTKNLKKRVLELVANGQELKFLVGFFYFSGLKELYQGLRENPDVLIKVLVGLNVDKTIYGLIECGFDGTRESKEEIINNFFQSIKISINTDVFDNKEFYEQVKFFIELINSERLLIRKTIQPNHAKLYLFKLNESQVARKNLFITGSSNLTASGLTRQQEFNVEISDYGFEEAEKYFDKLWSEAGSIPITEDESVRKRLIEVLKKETLIKEITPFEAYALVLNMYLETYRGKTIRQSLIDLLREQGYKVYKYQMDAVSQALAIIEKHNGVIIADVVGLGKTIVACSIAFELGKRGIVIAPPGLIGNDAKTEGWKKYLEEFKLSHLGWDAFSLGDLEKVLKFVSKVQDIEVVIMDEAHRFRNQDTKSYELLKNICRGKIVILLTATPFNNRPSDIFSLLKLFITPKKSTITLTDDLETKFRIFKSTFEKLAYIKKNANSLDHKKAKRAKIFYKELFGEDIMDINKVKKRTYYLARQIRNVIEPIIIRRNRLDLLENPRYKNEVTELSKVEDPIEWFYELTKEQSEFYDKVINEYFAPPEEGGKFKGAIYRPFIYEKGKTIDELFEDDLTKEETFQFHQQFNLYEFMRRLLVKRFESSFGAFEQSLRNFKEITSVVLGFIEKTGRYIMDRTLLEKIYEKDIDEIEEHLREYAERIKRNEYPDYHKIYEIEKFQRNEEFLADIESDLKLFDHVLEELKRLKLVENDPKVMCLIKNIKKVLSKSPSPGEPKRKIVIFSEYKDTVKYLVPILDREFQGRVFTVYGNLTKSKITEIYKNFDASLPEREQEDRYDILLTTDRLSEGFNLNRAGMVINYDIPWNPVRVIQRVGRINRISKKVFDSLYIVNFFPTEKGADLVRSREIAANKMFLIHNTLGEDSKIFDIDEEPTPSGLYAKIQQNPELLEGESFYVQIVREFEKIKKEAPEIVNTLKDLPPRIKVAKAFEEDELIVVVKKGNLHIYYKNYHTKEPPQILSLEEVIDKIKAEKEEKALQLSDIFWDYYEEIKNYREITPRGLSENSLLQRAINNLKSILKLEAPDELNPLKPFVKTLIEDIFDYGTLSDYTLRRLANINIKRPENIISELTKLREELGEDYLEKEKQHLKSMEKEIIIAIENRKGV
jgi:superfamily II DNA or RNA helicase